MYNINEVTRPVIKSSKIFNNNNRELPLPVSNAQYIAKSECELAGLNKKKQEIQNSVSHLFGQTTFSAPLPFLNMTNGLETSGDKLTNTLSAIPQHSQSQHLHIPGGRLQPSSITPASEQPLQNSTYKSSFTNNQISSFYHFPVNNTLEVKNYMPYSTIQKHYTPTMTPYEQSSFSTQPNSSLEKLPLQPAKQDKYTNDSNTKKMKFQKNGRSKSRKPSLSNQQNCCKTCNKICQSPSALKIHMAIHSDGKPYKCYFCDKFISKFASNRNRHMKQVHQWEK